MSYGDAEKGCGENWDGERLTAFVNGHPERGDDPKLYSLGLGSCGLRVTEATKAEWRRVLAAWAELLERMP